MFFRSFCGSVGRVVVFTTLALGVAAAAVWVYQWSPAVQGAADTIRTTLGA